MHRPSNVDDPEQLGMLMEVVARIATDMPVVFPVHPRTRKNIVEFGIEVPPSVILLDPVGYVEFLALMKSAAMVVTDSGGIQEETTALGVPCITSRTTTERPITVECGTNILVEPTRGAILDAVEMALRAPFRPSGTAKQPSASRPSSPDTIRNFAASAYPSSFL
jgi:UDP-N-acetylglucosamine 2-epimerase (non-hydrolysing)